VSLTFLILILHTIMTSYDGLFENLSNEESYSESLESSDDSELDFNCEIDFDYPFNNDGDEEDPRGPNRECPYDSESELSSSDVASATTLVASLSLQPSPSGYLPIRPSDTTVSRS
jgi:hypothetical protein